MYLLALSLAVVKSIARKVTRSNENTCRIYTRGFQVHIHRENTQAEVRESVTGSWTPGFRVILYGQKTRLFWILTEYNRCAWTLTCYSSKTAFVDILALSSNLSTLNTLFHERWQPLISTAVVSCGLTKKVALYWSDLML